jgi:hypothetical protein
VRELRAGSPDFEARWREHDVTQATHATKQLRHPKIGTLHLVCDVLLVPDQDQHVVLLSAAPGTETARVLGTLTTADA